jgi:hypothetical protein
VIATDGLWDVVRNEEVPFLVRDGHIAWSCSLQLACGSRGEFGALHEMRLLASD